MRPFAVQDRETGERVRPEPHNTLYLEHLSAYDLAARLVPSGVVVDVGCGHGYGAAHLFALCGHAPLPSEWRSQAARP